MKVVCVEVVGGVREAEESGGVAGEFVPGVGGRGI